MHYNAKLLNKADKNSLKMIKGSEVGVSEQRSELNDMRNSSSFQEKAINLGQTLINSDDDSDTCYESDVASFETYTPGFDISKTKSAFSVENKHQRYLFCVDWDDTVMNGHCHNFLCDIGKIAGEEINDDLIDLIMMKIGVRAPEQIKNLFSTILTNNHFLAITSYTNFDTIIKPILKRIGLTDSELNKILVVGGFPNTGGKLGTERIIPAFGKQLHIDKAITHFGCESLPKSDVILIDDSSNNCGIAELYGHTVCLVPRPILSQCKSLNEAALVDALSYEGIFEKANQRGLEADLVTEIKAHCTLRN